MIPHPHVGLYRPVAGLILAHEAARRMMADAAARQAAYQVQRVAWRADHPNKEREI